MKILFCCADQEALAYYRCTAPGRWLQANGHAQVCAARNWNKEHVDWADVVVFQRLLGDVIANVAEYCRMRGKKTVFEVDDNIMRYPDSPEYRHPSIRTTPERVRRVVTQCDAVFCSTQAIAETFREEFGKPTYVVRNALVLEDVDFPAAGNLRPVKREGEITVGWFGGHYHHDDLQMIEGALIRVLKDFPTVRLRFVGMLPKKVLEAAPRRVFYEAFVPFAKFWPTVSRMGLDVALAPLYPTEFARGRSNLRLLQYGVLGVPAVVSDFGEYGATAHEGYPCVIAGEDGWYEAIAYLIADREAAGVIGRAAGKWVTDNYSMDVIGPQWASAFRDVLELETGGAGAPDTPAEGPMEAGVQG